MEVSEQNINLEVITDLKQNVENTGKENEIKTYNTKHKHKRIQRFSASGSSDNEDNQLNNLEAATTDFLENDLHNKMGDAEIITKHKRTRQFSASDSSDNEVATANCLESNAFTHKKPTIRIMEDSDSDDEPTKIQTNPLSDEMDALKTSPPKIKKTNFDDLYDPESSDEGPPTNRQTEVTEVIKKKKVYKKRKSENEGEPKKMTPKDALERRREIRSCAQKMQREAAVSLPYHRPKVRTLQEFLENRPRFSSVFTNAGGSVSASIAAKMASEELQKAVTKLEERKKLVEEFFKSDSEEDLKSDCENDTNWEPEIETPIENNENSANENPENKTEVENTLTKDGDSSGINKEIEITESVQGSEIEKNQESESIQAFTQIAIAKEVETKVDESELENRIISDEIVNTESIEEVEPTEKIISEAEIVLNSEEEKTAEEKLIERLIKKYTSTEMDALNESPKLSKFELLKQQLGKSKPSLSGNPHQLIDLDDSAQPEGIQNFIDKVFGHIKSKNVTKDKIELDVINVIGGEIHKETVIMKVDPDDEPVATMETPGAKLDKLRKQLKSQMAQQRTEQWEQKIQMEPETAEDDDKKSEEDIKDILDDEDEFSSDSESTEEEDEDETALIDKPKVKSAFIDEEAEETDASDVEDEIEDVDEVEDDVKEDSTSNVDEFSNQHESSPVRKLKRIIKPFMEDSDDENPQTPNKELENCDNNQMSQDSCEDDDLPTHQKVMNTPKRDETPDLSFLTPVIQLTALTSLNSGNKDTSPGESSSPNHQFSKSQKQLFLDLSDTVDSEASNSEATDDNENSPEQLVENNIPSTQDLVNICSGNFGESLVSAEPSKNEEIKNLNEDQFEDKLISQLLDEEELENYKKFESPQRGILNSSDEEEEEEKISFSRKKRKLIYSDDESESDQDSIDENNAERVVNYDSEENEIEDAIKPTQFFEDEAELSESEWGSADEDEKGLDTLERELGDDETFDENKMRRDLERIHMRRVLDDDNHEVKILQELLLEDGELHGKGREKKFKWRNIDSIDGNEELKENETEMYFEDEESEEQWRKMRYQREQFLKEQQVERLEGEKNTLALKIQIQSNNAQTEKKPAASPTVKQPFALPHKRGSFLARGDQVLARLAEFTKVPDGDKTGAAKNSKHFIFQTVDGNATAGNKRKGSVATPKILKKLRLESGSPAEPKSNKKVNKINQKITLE